jgi:hypothetical protein
VFPPIYINGAINVTYREQLKTASGALKWDVDNIPTELNPNNYGAYVPVVGGTADLITLTPSLPIAAYSAGQSFQFIAAGANTGAVSVAVSDLAFIPIRHGSRSLVAGEIVSGSAVSILYDGVVFQIIDSSRFADAISVSRTGSVVNNLGVSAGDVEVVRFDASATSTHTRFLIYDVDRASLERVTVGANDSGGSGFRLLRIANT